MEDVSGLNGSKANISPGLHTVEVRATTDPRSTERRSVQVEPGAIARLEFKFSA
jgi:hypothetical protein